MPLTVKNEREAREQIYAYGLEKIVDGYRKYLTLTLTFPCLS